MSAVSDCPCILFSRLQSPFRGAEGREASEEGCGVVGTVMAGGRVGGQEGGKTTTSLFCAHTNATHICSNRASAACLPFCLESCHASRFEDHALPIDAAFGEDVIRLHELLGCNLVEQLSNAASTLSVQRRRNDASITWLLPGCSVGLKLERT
ncbi:unnamed protein product [Mesocestoides corti]|uniref:Uncharacterized protein n=1 Tax=Mesocestoides corti TaxID=53468 RepID=A0A0R3UIQ7_MESCO|nr:unnamed protein product [Mesocestoides corti]